MTIAHLVPVQSPSDQTAQAQGGSWSTPGVELLFFEPVADRITRHAKGALQTAQGTAFFVGTENLFPLFFGVTIGLRILAAAALANFAPEALFPIAGVPVSNQLFTFAVTTSQGDDNHAPQSLSSHLICPLPLSSYNLKRARNSCGNTPTC